MVYTSKGRNCVNPHSSFCCIQSREARVLRTSHGVKHHGGEALAAALPWRERSQPRRDFSGGYSPAGAIHAAQAAPWRFQPRLNNLTERSIQVVKPREC